MPIGWRGDFSWITREFTQTRSRRETATREMRQSRRICAASACAGRSSRFCEQPIGSRHVTGSRRARYKELERIRALLAPGGQRLRDAQGGRARVHVVGGGTGLVRWGAPYAAGGHFPVGEGIDLVLVVEGLARQRRVRDERHRGFQSEASSMQPSGHEVARRWLVNRSK